MSWIPAGFWMFTRTVCWLPLNLLKVFSVIGAIGVLLVAQQEFSAGKYGGVAIDIGLAVGLLLLLGLALHVHAWMRGQRRFFL